VPILIDRGEDVKYSKDIGDHEVQVSKGKVSTGAILSHQRSAQFDGGSQHVSNLRPLPKILTSGSLTDGSIFPSGPRNLSGLNVPGSG